MWFVFWGWWIACCALWSRVLRGTSWSSGIHLWGGCWCDTSCWLCEHEALRWSRDSHLISSSMVAWHCFSTLMSIKALSHLADLARWSYTGAEICRFSGIGTSTAAQRYHIAKNGSTSVRTSATKLAMAGDGRNFWTCSKISAVALPERATTLLRYSFVNVGRAPVAPRNGSAALRWPQ